MESRRERCGNLREIVCIAAVVSADHDHQIHTRFFELAHRILAVLCGAANRVERIKALGHFLRAVSLVHGDAKHFGDLERFGTEHRGLVGETDALQMQVGIETAGYRPAKARRKLGFVAAVFDVVANAGGFVLVSNDEVVRACKQRSAGKRGFRFLVFELSVNDRCDACARVSLDVLPDIENRAAGCIDHNATLL